MFLYGNFLNFYKKMAGYLVGNKTTAKYKAR